ncbi:hypothetical protein L484_009532 [Morus notabilis]|uniref:ABC1 atypical kinase-like domain-containing protein n=1 Tax=Morus notabilis TaxID=981085 RepID=W9R407_9ROSA|nr:hypothetical protein L484_009532 [Morus notabilis]
MKIYSENICLFINSDRIYDRVGASNSLCRLFLYYKPSLREYSLYKANNNLLKSGGFRNFHGLATSNTISHHAQITWKRCSQLCSYGGLALPPIGRIACAVSLALTRSNLVAPGIIAFVVGEFALMERSWAEAEQIPTRGTLNLNAQDGHVHLTSFLFSLLEFFILFLRAIYLVLLFSPCITMAPFIESLGIQYRKIWLSLVHHRLEKAGPAFIKWGQWAATRPDLFPRDLCSELAKLHTKASAHSFSFSKKSIKSAFGCKLPEIFDLFEEQRVASGSVAQVHQATLKYRCPGQQIKPIVVAVKVRHPDESIQQFAVFMMSQVDLSREAAHLSRFIYNFSRWKDVSFPMPLYPPVHPSVLVETYEQGESVMHYVDELEGHEKIKTALAHIGSHALLKMLLVDNFVHADMHPGNILVRVTKGISSPERLFKSRPHVIFLDEVEKAFKYWDSPQGELVSPGDCMKQLLEQVRRHKVNIDGNVCTVMVTTLVLEGWQQKLDPEYDVMHTLRTLLFKVNWAESFFYTIEGLMAP